MKKTFFNMPEFRYEIVSLEDEIELITEIICDAIDNNTLFSDMLYKKYPKLENLINIDMTKEQIKQTLQNSIADDYEKNKEDILKSITKFSSNWNTVKDALLNRLQNDLDMRFSYDSIITVRVGNAPLCPRWIEDLSFYVPSYISNFNLIALHECCHFLFFSKYMSIYECSDYAEFEYPNKVWLLSEVLIDPILNTPFYVKIIKEQIKSYDVFYRIDINGKNLVESIKEIVIAEHSPERYIKKGLEFINTHSENICYY